MNNYIIKKRVGDMDDITIAFCVNESDALLIVECLNSRDGDFYYFVGNDLYL